MLGHRGVRTTDLTTIPITSGSGYVVPARYGRPIRSDMPTDLGAVLAKPNCS